MTEVSIERQKNLYTGGAGGDEKGKKLPITKNSMSKS